CVNALAVADPETALRQAEADNIAVVQFLEDSKKNPAMAVDAKLRAESAARMLAFGRAGLSLPRLAAEKAAADQRLAEATAAVAAPKATTNTTTKTITNTKTKTNTT